jgi:hypothetical protein
MLIICRAGVVRQRNDLGRLVRRTGQHRILITSQKDGVSDDGSYAV